MVDLELIQSIFYTATAISVVCTAFYYAVTLRNAAKARQTELFMKLYERWYDESFQQHWMEVIYKWQWADYDDYERKYMSGNIQAFASGFSVLAYFEGIGVLVKRKLIDIDLVDDLMSTSILWYWEKTGSMVIESRKRSNRPQLLEWSEYLYNELVKREKRLSKRDQKAPPPLASSNK
jgi:hypothetical protein